MVESGRFLQKLMQFAICAFFFAILYCFQKPKLANCSGGKSYRRYAISFFHIFFHIFSSLKKAKIFYPSFILQKNEYSTIFRLVTYLKIPCCHVGCSFPGIIIPVHLSLQYSPQHNPPTAPPLNYSTLATTTAII